MNRQVVCLESLNCASFVLSTEGSLDERVVKDVGPSRTAFRVISRNMYVCSMYICMYVHVCSDTPIWVFIEILRV